MTKIRLIIKYLPYLLQSIYFNFHYLPIRQAIKLPILLYKPHLLQCDGQIIIESEDIYTGMIQLGVTKSLFFSNSGMRWINEGGKCVFNGRCILGNNASVFIAKGGSLIFGSNFISTVNGKICARQKVVFGENVLLGWGVIVMDSSFHRLKKKNGDHKEGDIDKEIVVGRDNWFGVNCLILKGTKTPDYCIFGANSLLNKDYSNNPSYILMAGNPVEIKSTDIWRDPFDDAL